MEVVTGVAAGAVAEHTELLGGDDAVTYVDFEPVPIQVGVAEPDAGIAVVVLDDSGSEPGVGVAQAGDGAIGDGPDGLAPVDVKVSTFLSTSGR